MASIPVLVYHAIRLQQESEPESRHVSLRAFGEQVAELKQAGYRSITIEEADYRLVAGHKSDKVVAITFDQGYGSQFELAMPILARYGFVATLFAVTDWIAVPTLKELKLSAKIEQAPGDRPLTWFELESLIACGWSVQSQGKSYTNLIRVNGRRLAREIIGSQKLLSERLVTPVTAFAYPFGAYNARAQAFVGRHFKQAYGSHAGFTSEEEPFRYQRHRIAINGADTIERFRLKLSSGYAGPITRVRSRLRDRILAATPLGDKYFKPASIR